MPSQDNHPASFRDPSGHLFYDDGMLLRQVNTCYRDDYDALVSSGLYRDLTEAGYLVSHREIGDHPGTSPDTYLVMAPEMVDFVSYPYEWSFSQYRDAALLTLRMQKMALKHGMWLKDASAFNVQFNRGRPVFIDSLSFERYPEGMPWIAYRQFVQHFLAPLALMSHRDARLARLMQFHLDGIPLDLTSRLLPWRTRFRLALFMHIHMHARMQNKYSDTSPGAKKTHLPKRKLLAITENLMDAVRSMRLPARKTEWGDYYAFTNYSEGAFSHKKRIVAGFIERIGPRRLWDVGANTGEFTAIAAKHAPVKCLAFDSDPLAVDICYRNGKKGRVTNVLPLVSDITNPTPAIGWDNRERMALVQRELPDAVMALALIHHLAITSNVPLEKIASFFAAIAPNLIIEFVPRNDSQARKLLSRRSDGCGSYNEEGFRRAFGNHFRIVESRKIDGSLRILYRMERIRHPG